MESQRSQSLMIRIPQQLLSLGARFWSMAAYPVLARLQMDCSGWEKVSGTIP